MTRPDRRPWRELRVLMDKDGANLTYVAKASGLSLSYVSQLASGDREPNATVTRRIADALHVPFSMLEKREPEDDEVVA